MAHLIELWDRDGEYKVSVNPNHIVSMRALTSDEADEGEYGTVIELLENRTIIVTNMYDDVYKAANDAQGS